MPLRSTDWSSLAKSKFIVQISDNFNSGVDTFEPDPGNGPFGFGAALKLDGTQVRNTEWRE